MMQNSLERLFEGMGETLSETIAPALTDAFALSQVSTMIELLRNIATRVQWRADHSMELIGRIQEILRFALNAGCLPRLDIQNAGLLVKKPVPDSSDHEGLVESKQAHLAALADIQKGLAEIPTDEEKELRAIIQEFILWHLEVELACLCTGMYKTKTKKP